MLFQGLGHRLIQIFRGTYTFNFVHSVVDPVFEGSQSVRIHLSADFKAAFVAALRWAQLSLKGLHYFLHVAFAGEVFGGETGEASDHFL